MKTSTAFPCQTPQELSAGLVPLLLEGPAEIILILPRAGGADFVSALEICLLPCLLGSFHTQILPL